MGLRCLRLADHVAVPGEAAITFTPVPDAFHAVSRAALKECCSRAMSEEDEEAVARNTIVVMANLAYCR